MKLTDREATSQLKLHSHGILATVHAARGVDAVPVVYAVDDGFVGIPVDTVKAKASAQLQRERNLNLDPRATLLIEQWDRHDWSKLWWVRAELRYTPGEADREQRLASQLVEDFVQYQDRPFHRILALRITNVSGWKASS